MTYRSIPLNQLEISRFNVRKDKRAQSPAAIEAMKKSLLARGQIMPMVVHPQLGRNGYFGVVAGQRRYLAFKLAAKQGLIPPDFPIDTMVRDVENEAQLISLSTVENVQRHDLYAYETYYGLARSYRRGNTIEELADDLGQDVDWVRRGVRLGLLPEPIFAVYSAGEISLETAKAFAGTEDAELQLHVFRQFQALPAPQRNAQSVRGMLKIGDRELDRLLRFVGERAYRDAGGRYELDLFADDGDVRGLVRDEGKLRDMAAAKREDLIKRIRIRAGRPDLRFGAAPPKNGFEMTEWKLQILPPHTLLGDDDEQRLRELRDEEAAGVEKARSWLDADGNIAPEMAPALRALEERDAAIEAAIAEIEDKRPILLPEGDIFATIDIADDGSHEVRYWWKDLKALEAASAPDPKPAPAKEPPPPRTAKPLKPGAAIAAPIGEPFQARVQADAEAKKDFGLTQDGVQAMRSLRRSILGGLLIQDAWDSGKVGRDYFIWGQLRMVLTGDGRADVGLTPLHRPERDNELAADVIADAVGGSPTTLLGIVGKWDCFREKDPRASFARYADLSELEKNQAAAVLAAFALERSLDADGYQIPVHDVVALETGAGAAREVRAMGVFKPTPTFFNLFSKEHSLGLALPYVARADIAAWTKLKTGERNDRLAKVFAGTSPDLIDGVMAENCETRPTLWVHDLLAFKPAEPEEDAAEPQLEEHAA